MRVQAMQCEIHGHGHFQSECHTNQQKYKTREYKKAIDIFHGSILDYCFTEAP
jgi:hypothetical protein